MKRIFEVNTLTGKRDSWRNDATLIGVRASGYWYDENNDDVKWETTLELPLHFAGNNDVQIGSRLQITVEPAPEVEEFQELDEGELENPLR